MLQTLNELPAGQSATVRGLATRRHEGIARRLMDLGLTGGAQVKCLFCAPSGGMCAYRIRGAVVALRSEDARLVRTGEGAGA